VHHQAPGKQANLHRWPLRLREIRSLIFSQNRLLELSYVFYPSGSPAYETKLNTFHKLYTIKFILLALLHVGNPGFLLSVFFCTLGG